MVSLHDIIAHKNKELTSSTSNWKAFRETFSWKKAKVLAEVKLASPTYDLSKEVSAKDLMGRYHSQLEICAYSILIDQTYFSWDIRRIEIAKEQKKLVLFKEFVKEKRQIEWAFYYWYDALLLLVKILSEVECLEYVHHCLDRNIYPIIEVDNEEDLVHLFDVCEKNDLSKKVWIWVNARNLSTMEIDISKHMRFAQKYAEQFKKNHMFAFSWVNEIKETQKYTWYYDGVLIWTSFVHKYHDLKHWKKE